MEQWLFMGGTSGIGYYPAAGQRDAFCTLFDTGSCGYYWSASVPSSSLAYSLKISNAEVSCLSNSDRSAAFSVRCVKE
jgi:uncharacterized protein (TIGR02145 family)